MNRPTRFGLVWMNPAALGRRAPAAGPSCGFVQEKSLSENN